MNRVILFLTRVGGVVLYCENGCGMVICRVVVGSRRLVLKSTGSQQCRQYP